MFKRHRFFWLVFALAVLLMFLISPVLIDLWLVDRMRSRVARLAVGDSADRVRDVLGEPTLVFPKSSFGVIRQLEAWAYGSQFDWPNSLSGEFPFFYPFRLRLFGPSADDIVIELDDTGTVVSISVP